MKFSRINENNQYESFEYPDIYFEEKLTTGSRLTIGPKSKQIKLIDELALQWKEGQYYALYVSLLSHTGREPGRYQSPVFNDLDELRVFLYTFQEFFEGDGRHHIWLGSPENGLLIYDQHNVIFAYGDIKKYKATLQEKGFYEKEFWFPVPHVHSYPSELTKYEDELFDYWEWSYSPLQEGDEYD